MLSLTTTGTPPRGLQDPFLRPASNASAALIAPASSSVMNALRFGFALARPSAAEVSALLVILPAHSSAAAGAPVNPSGPIAVEAKAGPERLPPEFKRSHHGAPTCHHSLTLR